MSKNVDKILGEPVVLEFSEYIRKLRANLLIISFLTISILICDLQIDSSSTVLGLRFLGLNYVVLLKGLLIINGYVLFHFLWCSIDFFQEWGIRVTGTRVVFITAARMASEKGDYPSDPRQSSLYNWWKEQAAKIGSLSEPIKNISEKLNDFESNLREVNGNNQNTNTNNIIQSINSVKDDILRLKKSIESVGSSLASERIPVSLERFDKRFSLFLRSQNLRWLMIELSLPLLMGIVSVALLFDKIY